MDLPSVQKHEQLGEQSELQSQDDDPQNPFPSRLANNPSRDVYDLVVVSRV